MKNLLVIILLALGILPVFAQTSTAEDLLLKQVSNASQLDLPGTKALLLQNSVLNTSGISQRGNNNSAVLQQYGISNLMHLRQQGNNNSYIGYINGTNLINDISQIGHGNKLQQDIQTDNQTYVVKQLGNGNDLTQIEIGLNAKSYTVEQTGNMKVIIVNGGGFSPVP